MKKLLIALILSLNFSTILHAEFLAVDFSSGQNHIYSVVNGEATLKKSFTFPSGGWQSSESYVDETTGVLFLMDSNREKYVTYNLETDVLSQVDTGYLTGYQAYFNVVSSVKDIIENTTNNDGVAVTKIKTSILADSDGDALVESKADGSIHIGENSLVTIESGGRQQLYATNSAGNQIDLNIKSGTNLLIGGRNIMDIIGGDISGSVALSSALAALPNFSPDAFYTCGLGTGIHDSSSALSAGCASDFSNYAFADNLPKIFQTASFNIGSSFLMNGEPDISEARDMSIKAGITFKFGSVKPTRVADRNNHMLENKIDAVMTENNLLKAQIAEINTQLKALNMVAMN